LGASSQFDPSPFHCISNWNEEIDASDTWITQLRYSNANHGTLIIQQRSTAIAWGNCRV